jgi:N-methylhydantoinase B
VLRRIPDGSYEFCDFMDDDMVTGIPVRVRLKLTARDGEIELDTSGTDPQVRSAYNVPSMGRRMYWLTFRLTTFLTSYDPLMPHNAGLYRGISVRTPRGSVLNAEYPDAVGVRAVAPRRLFDCVTGAILQARPELMPAASGGTSITVALAEIGADGFSRIVEVLEPLRCGMGARQGQDGVDARDNSLNNMRNHPLELIEAQSSILVREYDVRPDSGGPGEWRGGCAQTFTVEVLCDGGVMLARGIDRMRFPPWGAAGGRPGARLEMIHNRGRADERRLGKIHELHMRRGDTLTLNLAGGGGFGDPFRRDPARVLEDVAQGFVSAEGAARDYGVVVRDGCVDEAATGVARHGRGTADGFFDFGADRTAWELVFTDAAMDELNRLLYALPKAVRQDVRQEIFETVVPGITASEGQPLVDLLTDPEAARARLRRALDAHRVGAT